ncbi:hypothetical protein IW261DRAFT_1124114 [Armillaria novae-zelandiae]|uniref:Uncharacterized protein n=1 Tax=Armillaria novae-zelandiae TaxID=153914 RepID=A0AA39TX41_9AGAR|nr:hypothetical protein IW261DRAFT_1124114 [Armillaria novae-zelandiae]
MGLGPSVACLFDHFQNPSDADEATSLFKSAALAPTGESSSRLIAAMKWAMFCEKIDFSPALEAFKVLIELIPRSILTAQSIAEKHRRLAHFQAGPTNVVNVAAAYALAPAHLCG